MPESDDSGQVCSPHQEWDPLVLDALAADDFYASYKKRIRELLRPRSGGRYLDVGSGSGEAAIRFLAGHPVELVALDRSLRMSRLAKSRGVPNALAADAHLLPFASASFDGVYADRVFQHLDQPDIALAESARVLRPGGRLVLADPDYDLQALEIEDQELARRILRYRADEMVRNGALAHRQAARLVDLGFDDIGVEARTVVVRRPDVLDNVLNLRDWAHHAVGRGRLPVGDAERFVRQFDRAARDGKLTYVLTFLLTSGTKAR
ncbi:methyltransferase domain-containing protein [Nonomuraea sp. NPDC050328]|uniref:methyltransferase domain-containing protein n=1 Tax=Nonomuraea sp. NPDC050328 TaxID=3364361 RepID=UPI003790B621